MGLIVRAALSGFAIGMAIGGLIFLISIALPFYLITKGYLLP